MESLRRRRLAPFAFVGAVAAVFLGVPLAAQAPATPAPAPAAAQQSSGKIPWWSGTFEDIFEQAKQRNVPVVFVFIQDGEEANERVVAGVFADNDYRRAMRDAIPVVLSHEVHRLSKETVDGETRGVCSKFGGCPCEAHVRLEPQARGEFVGIEVQTPQHVFVLPDQTVFDRMIDVHSPGAYVEMIKKAQAKIGRGLGFDLYKSSLKALTEGRRLITLKDWSGALKIVRPAQKAAAGTELGKKLDRIEIEIEQAADAVIARAAELEKAGDAYGAVVMLDAAVKEFAAADNLPKLRKEAARIRTTPPGREAVKVLAREERARPSFTAAEKAATDRDYVKAARDYEKAAKIGEGTPLAAEAERRLDALRSDPAVKAMLDRASVEVAAGNALKAAEQMLSLGEKAKAKDAFADVVKNHAGTKAAEAAQKRLADWK